MKTPAATLASQSHHSQTTGEDLWQWAENHRTGLHRPATPSRNAEVKSNLLMQWRKLAKSFRTLMS
ncbi:MAG: hypothetical protein ABI443_09120 [Chthoniobacterales bacterium]